MIRLHLHNGETREARDDVFDLSALGVYHYDCNEAGIRTGEWTLIPWSSIHEVHRVKDKHTP